jgi:hypothetical protein
MEVAAYKLETRVKLVYNYFYSNNKIKNIINCVSRRLLLPQLLNKMTPNCTSKSICTDLPTT